MRCIYQHVTQTEACTSSTQLLFRLGTLLSLGLCALLTSRGSKIQFITVP
jgi:hypothetical protein